MLRRRECFILKRARAKNVLTQRSHTVLLFLSNRRDNRGGQLQCVYLAHSFWTFLSHNLYKVGKQTQSKFGTGPLGRSKPSADKRRVHRPSGIHSHQYQIIIVKFSQIEMDFLFFLFFFFLRHLGLLSSAGCSLITFSPSAAREMRRYHRNKHVTPSLNPFFGPG